MKRLFYTLLFLVCFHATAHAQAPTRLGVPTSHNGISTVGDPAISSGYSPLPVTQAGSSFVNVSTNADTVVKASPGTLNGVTVNTAGVNSGMTIYDNATCTGTVIAKLATTAQGLIAFGGVQAGTGICVTTTGDTPADITVIYR